MTTWTFSNSYVAMVVTADSILLAIAMIREQLIKRGYDHCVVSPEDLIPCPVHHRYIRTLFNIEEH